MKPRNYLKSPVYQNGFRIRHKNAFAKWARENPGERERIEARYKNEKVNDRK